MGSYRLYLGNCIEVMKGMPANSVDSIITDPPYALTGSGSGGFMGKSWDGVEGFEKSLGVGKSNRSPALIFQEFSESWAREALRVLKPGGHLLLFSAARTYHRMACAIEDAGFEIRDQIRWLYVQGMPKSLNVGKAIDKRLKGRYGEKKCNCLDTQIGLFIGDDAGRGSRNANRFFGTSCFEKEEEVGIALLQVKEESNSGELQNLRETNYSTPKGLTQVKESFLLGAVCERSTKESRYGYSSVWTGMEEEKGRSSGPGSSMSNMSEDSRGERVKTSCSSSSTLPIRREQSDEQSSSSLLFMSPQDGGYNDSHFIEDFNRYKTRRLILDDCGGRRTAMALTCSWCGYPDAAELVSMNSFGTSLKPAHEPLVLARKPLIGTVAQNVLEYGTGAINIDGCRVECTSEQQGRWPANLIHDGSEEVVAAFPEAKGQQGPLKYGEGEKTSGIYGKMRRENEPSADRTYVNKGSTNFAMKPGARRLDTGPAARFFFAAKSSGKDRNGGLPTGSTNKHPTVKPLSLCRYITRLITPPGGTTMDPFGGSGSISRAALQEGFNSIYIDSDPESYATAEQRISSVEGSYNACD